MVHLSSVGADLSEGTGPVIGAAIGRPDLRHVQFSYEEVIKALIGVGASADAARGRVELNRAMNEGRGIVALPRDERSATPTTLEPFAEQVFAPAFVAGGAAAS